MLTGPALPADRALTHPAEPAWPAEPAQPALLVLEDGTAFTGRSFGAPGEALGEAVFATGMTGYQETLTDPSYFGQIITMTTPHIGNTGVNDSDAESSRIWASGLVVREPARVASSWRATRTLDSELRAHGVPGIAIRGTRALTVHLREHGAMRAAISSREADPGRLLDRVLASPPMTGADLAGQVSTRQPYQVQPPPGTAVRLTVVAVDLGIKAATPRELARLGCTVHVLPADCTAAAVGELRPDGVLFSNGPGDPAATAGPVPLMRELIAAGTPVFGICLGSQLLGRALGLGTYKLPFGHRGVNQPVMDLATGRVQITSHNHGFAIAVPDRGAGTAAAAAVFDTSFGPAQVTHISLNDGVVEGLRLLDRPAFAVQFHPEAAPGTHDAAGQFAGFCDLMARARGSRRPPGGC